MQISITKSQIDALVATAIKEIKHANKNGKLPVKIDRDYELRLTDGGFPRLCAVIHYVDCDVKELDYYIALS